MKSDINKLKVRICGICQKKVYNDDKYCRLTEFCDGLQVGDGFYHVSCYRERFVSVDQLKAKADNMINSAQDIIQRIKGN